MQTAKSAQKLGVATDEHEMEENLKLMKPKHNLTLEGQQVFFWSLYEKLMENAELDEGEIDDSNAPSEKEIDILTGQVKQPEPFI